MSFEDVDTVLKAKIPGHMGVEPPMLKLVLLAIAQHTSGRRGDHSAFPALKRLALMTGASQSSVSRAIDALAGLGLFKEYVRGGGRKRSHYVIDIAKLGYMGIDWKAAGFQVGTQSSESEPSLPVTEPRVPSRNTKGSVTEPNKVLNQGSYPGLEQGSVTATGSLRSPDALRAAARIPDENKHRNPKPKGPGASGARPEDKTGRRIEKPFRRECKKCGAPLERDKNHQCEAKAASASDDRYARMSDSQAIDETLGITENQKKYGNDLGVPPL